MVAKGKTITSSGSRQTGMGVGQHSFIPTIFCQIADLTFITLGIGLKVVTLMGAAPTPVHERFKGVVRSTNVMQKFEKLNLMVCRVGECQGEGYNILEVGFNIRRGSITCFFMIRYFRININIGEVILLDLGGGKDKDSSSSSP